VSVNVAENHRTEEANLISSPGETSCTADQCAESRGLYATWSSENVIREDIVMRRLINGDLGLVACNLITRPSSSRRNNGSNILCKWHGPLSTPYGVYFA